MAKPVLNYIIYEVDGQFHWVVSYEDIEYARSIGSFDTEAKCKKDYNHFHMFLGEYMNEVASSSWGF